MNKQINFGHLWRSFDLESGTPPILNSDYITRSSDFESVQEILKRIDLQKLPERWTNYDLEK